MGQNRNKDGRDNTRSLNFRLENKIKENGRRGEGELEIGADSEQGKADGQTNL